MKHLSHKELWWLGPKRVPKARLALYSTLFLLLCLSSFGQNNALFYLVNENTGKQKPVMNSQNFKVAMQNGNIHIFPKAYNRKIEFGNGEIVINDIVLEIDRISYFVLSKGLPENNTNRCLTGVSIYSCGGCISSMGAIVNPNSFETAMLLILSGSLISMVGLPIGLSGVKLDLNKYKTSTGWKVAPPI